MYKNIKFHKPVAKLNMLKLSSQQNIFSVKISQLSQHTLMSLCSIKIYILSCEEFPFTLIFVSILVLRYRRSVCGDIIRFVCGK